MRVGIDLDPILSRGASALRDPVLWPIWFLIDDTPLRYLAGDITASAFVQAPGPAAATGDRTTTRWTRDISAFAMPADEVLVGFGLLLTAGDADDPELSSAYADLAARVRALALTRAAQTSGLGGLLVAFGGDGEAPDGDGHEKLLSILREGATPEQLDRWIAPQMLGTVSAFNDVAEVLAPLMPGAPPSSGLDTTSLRSAPPLDLARAPAAAPELPSAAPASPIGGRPDLRRAFPGAAAALRPGSPGIRIPPAVVPPPLRPADTEPAVVAATVQAWPLRELRERGRLKIERALPVPGMPRASLVLRGTISLET